ncbi:ribonuclease H-like domain-containing protein [Tanacetum coccineum]
MPNPSMPNPHLNPTSINLMVRRFHVGTNKKNMRYNFHVSTISPIPKSYTTAIRDPKWQRVMLDEYNGLIENNTWVLVPRPPNANIVRSMWLFKHKYFADGSLSRYKARLIANGNTQQLGPLVVILPRHLLWQYTLSHSSVKAKYCGVANAVAEMFWLRNLLRELHSPLHSATIVYCDNVAKGQVHILHVPSRYQYADIFTKVFARSLEFCLSTCDMRSDL